MCRKKSHSYLLEWGSPMTRMPPGVAIATLALAVLGLAFFWIVPLGMILSLAGLPVGLLGLAMRPAVLPRAHTLRLGLVVAVVGLVIEVWTSWDMLWPGR